MNTFATVTIHANDDANIHGDSCKSDGGMPYSSVWVGETLLLFWDKAQLEVMRDLCNKQLNEWGKVTTP